MIKGIFIMHKSGIVLYNKTMSKISPDEQIVGGFLSAIYRFCNVSFGEKISYFCTSTLRFNYFHQNDLYFVFISDKNDKLKNLMPNFQKLMKDFYREFAHQRFVFEKQGLVPVLTNFETAFSNICS
ncbi:MAG: hypothetical protein ACTSO9_09900 [Candidatus Helarchaeota archaeon]